MRAVELPAVELPAVELPAVELYSVGLAVGVLCLFLENNNERERKHVRHIRTVQNRHYTTLNCYFYSHGCIVH